MVLLSHIVDVYEKAPLQILPVLCSTTDQVMLLCKLILSSNSSSIIMFHSTEVSMVRHCSIFHCFSRGLLDTPKSHSNIRRTLVESNMTAVVKTLIQARPVGRDSLLSTNIPFLDSSPDAFSTTFQEDFKPVSSKRTKPFSKPDTAQVDHKDLRYNKGYLTETNVSYQHHPLPQVTRTPHWTKLYTNFKLQTDPKEVSFLTTKAQEFWPQPFQPPRTPIRHTETIKTIQQVEKFPESTYRDSFIRQHGSPVVKATAKHLSEGFPTIKGDRRHHNIVSQYNSNFQGAWSRAAQSVKKHTSSVAMGDPVKIVERETTHTASFNWPTVCRPPVVKEHVKLNLGPFCKDSWSSTSREDFCHKLGDPVVLIRRNQNSSSFPEGDTDPRRNKERMSVTTNRISFSDLSHTQRPVHVHGPELLTKSNVQFSSPSLSGLCYTTTANEHYSKKVGERVKPVIQRPSNILSGPEHGPSLSTTATDYLPVETYKRRTPCQSQQRNSIRFPLSHQHFSTTHSEDYTAKPLIMQRRGRSQFITHFVMQ